MRKIHKSKIHCIAFIFSAMFFLSVVPTKAQIGELGIYGSTPHPGMPNIRYVRVYTNPLTVTGGSEQTFNYTIPVNGLSNFNIYYDPNGNFLPQGNYIIEYLGADRITSYGSESVIYTPNTGFTNGVQVRPFNAVAQLPLGIHGTVIGEFSDLTSTYQAPLSGATVVLQEVGGSIQINLKTNADGFFSAYYTNGTSQEFLPSVNPYAYSVLIYYQIGNCTYIHFDYAFWSPLNVNNPNASDYFVTWARYNMNIPVLVPQCSY